MQIGGFQKVSLIDYPGKICSIVFVQGCNFRCGFCYNPELAIYDLRFKNYELKERGIFDYLERRKKEIEGVCVSGGEPCLQKDLPEFLRKIKEMRFLIKLDTNGSNPEMLRKLIKENFVDYIAMDIKAPLEKFQISNSKFQINSKSQIPKYDKVTNVKVNLNKIKNSIEIIKNSNINYEFRTTVVPGLLNKEDIIEIAKQIKGAQKYVLQGFVNNKKMIDFKYKNVEPYSKEILEEMAEGAREFVGECEIRL